MSRPMLLVVDDERNVLIAFNQVFRREPCAVLTAGGAKEALDLLAQHPIDILITDNRMPGMSGIQLLREAKQAYPGVFRVLATGELNREDFLRATEEADVQRIIYKPWDVDELLATVRELLWQRAAREDEA